MQPWHSCHCCAAPCLGACRYSSSARLEAEILQRVNDRDKDGSSRVVRFYEMFEWRGHVCMVFEALGKSLYDYVKLNKYRPLPLRCVQTFSKQLLQSIAFLHRMKLVHTDLKPENVLLLDTKFRRVSAPTMRRDGRRVLEPEITTIKGARAAAATAAQDPALTGPCQPQLSTLAGRRLSRITTAPSSTRGSIGRQR